VRIEVRGLTKRFGSVEALRGVSFEVPAGRRVALIGPNGSGKSTLNRALMGLVRCQGEVRLDGALLGEDGLDLARRRAYVPQIAPAFAVPVGELLGALVRIRGASLERVRELALHLELDLDSLWRQPFRDLSGGTKQKLLIALALASGASLLILDEPTGSLDARSRERFPALLEESAGGATVLLCSHRLGEVRQLVDHVLALHEGLLVHDGPADAFLDSCTRGLLEVRAEGGEAARWLASRGFRRGGGPWWLRSATPEQKLALLAELGPALGPALRDVIARDGEAQAPRGPGAPPGGGGDASR
jgi:ABC-type multidrug transport system ATPase subunit